MLWAGDENSADCLNLDDAELWGTGFGFWIALLEDFFGGEVSFSVFLGETLLFKLPSSSEEDEESNIFFLII